MKKKGTAFKNFFRYFPKLLAAGLMFSVPLAAFTGLFILIGYLTGFNNIIVWGLSIIPSAQLLAGLVMFVRKIAVENEDAELFPTFIKSVKENLGYFLIHGVAIYLITACTFFSVLYYGSMAGENITYGSILSIYLVFTAILVTAMFYAPLMTVTYELSIKDIYKNSFLLVFGKILRNLGALVLIILVSLLAFFGVMYTNGILLWITVGLIVIIYPLLFVYISVSVVSKGMQESVGSFVNPVKVVEDDSDAVQQAIKSSNGDSDYVFVNGKMVKVDKK